MSTKKILILLLLGVLLFLSCNSKKKEYDMLLKTADSLYHKNEFQSAKSLYQKALENQPLDSNLYNKIIHVNKALIMRNKEAQYQKVIIIADSYFKNENYIDAQKAYINASKIKHDDQYAKERMAAINPFLVKSRKQQSKPYHIIVGSFKNEFYATRLNEKLLSKGYNSIIIPRFNGTFNAVSYTSHVDVHDALNNLSEAKQNIHPKSWVLKYASSAE